MIWDIDYTEDAAQDLQDIYDYIADVLLEPVIAAKQLNRIMDAVDTLGHMPFRYHSYDKEPWCAKGLRILPVDNYLIYYLPIESKKTVSVIRIMYGGRDIDKQLKNLNE